MFSYLFEFANGEVPFHPLLAAARTGNVRYGPIMA
jgi:hypothetical protein